MASRTDVEREAMKLRAWAEQAGVFAQGRSSGSVPSLDRLRAGGMFGSDAVDAFVSKPITAVGFAASERREPRVFVYTRRKLTKAEEAQLKRDNKLEAPVEFRVAQPFSVATPGNSARFSTMFKNDRLCCGSSIGVGNVREAGTLGALLKDGDGAMFGLSCNHVTGGCSNARRGTPIVAPGVLDVGADAPHPRVIGTHARTLQFIQGDPTSVPTFKENADIAIFGVTDPKALTSWQGDAYDTPATVADPEEDAPVEKVGRTTGHTSGIIESRLVGPLRIDYNKTIFHSAEENVTFRGTVFFEPVYVARGGAGSFAVEGDSGSLVVSRENGASRAVGVVIGGRPGEETYILPLKPALDKLKLTLVSNFG